MHLPNNTLLQGGKYKITRFIASGGFGCTYEGMHTMLETKVAIKEFFPKMFCNRDENTSHVTVATQGNRDLVAKLRKKFNEEAIAVFRMSHPNIVRVLDVFEENGTAYYVMDYVDGKSLNDIVKERGALPESEAVGYIRQVAEALKYVHSLNRLHLDIKPGNIMVDKNGKAILIDFGASKHYDDESGENTSTLMGVNTVGYAPLEQLNQSFTSFSPATDVYALGATLYKLLTTITPPSALSLVSEDEELIPLSKNISQNIRHVVSQAMELKRKRRFQSMDGFLALLESGTSIAGKVNDEMTIAEEQKPKLTEPTLTIVWEGVWTMIDPTIIININNQNTLNFPFKKPFKDSCVILPADNHLTIKCSLIKNNLSFTAIAGMHYTLHIKYSSFWDRFKYIISDNMGKEIIYDQV